ncbi:hypothetical protein Elgi_47410 [Paenibacillus elgii]|nr:hypothetical protein Elgi_47410 [Paenibacillus elgii]
MPDVRFHRAESAKLLALRLLAERFRQAVDFDGIAQLRPRPVRFDVRDRFRIDARAAPSLRNHFRLRRGVRSGDADRASVLIDRAPFNNRDNVVPVLHGFAQRLQKHGPNTLTPARSVRIVIERSGPVVGRFHTDARLVRQQNCFDATRQRHLAIPAENRLASEMHRNERRRAGRIDRDRRPFQIEQVSDAA